MVQEGEMWGDNLIEEVWVSLELRLWSAEDALCLLHFRATVAGVVHLQTIIQFIQVLFYLPYLLPGYMLQPEAHLWRKKISEFGVTPINIIVDVYLLPPGQLPTGLPVPS